MLGRREKEFVKSAGFILMTVLAVHDGRASGAPFFPFFPIIREVAEDGRDGVKKMSTWRFARSGRGTAP